MAVSFVGQNSAQGTTVALPAHQAGDLIVIFAYTDGGATAPALASGYTNVGAGNGSSNGHRIGYKIATSDAETSGMWSAATQISVAIYRGIDPATPVGAYAAGTNTADVFAPALTLQDTSGASWVFVGVGRREGNLTAIGNPSGLTARADTGSSPTGRINTYDTAAGVTSWPQKNFGGSNTSRFRAVSMEIRGTATPAPNTGTLNKTLGSLTAVGSADLDIKGQGGGVLRPLTGQSTAKLANRGTVSKTLASVLLSSASMLPGTGRVDKTLGALTSAASGRSPKRADLTKTLGQLTAIGTGHVADDNEGSLSQALRPLTATSTAKLRNTGRAVITLESVVLAATAEHRMMLPTPRERTITVEPQNRGVTVEAQNRTVYA